MSRTKEFTLPRIPNTSPRVVPSLSVLGSSEAATVQAISTQQNQFKSFLGCHRQDVTSAVFKDNAMFDDIFCKEGRLEEQNAPKASMPLTCRPYNSLHDRHVRHLYASNPGMRKHLVKQEFITNEMRICSSTKEIHQKIRSHEMLEGKEQRKRDMEERESERLGRLQQAQARKVTKDLPPILEWSEHQERKRQLMKRTVKARKTFARQQKEKKEAEKERNKRQLQRQEWLKHIEEQELEQEKRRRAEILRQQQLRSAHYDRKFADMPRGQQLAEWHKEADALHSRITYMQHQVWFHRQTDNGQPTSAGTARNRGAAGQALNLDSLERDLPGLDDAGQPHLVLSQVMQAQADVLGPEAHLDRDTAHTSHRSTDQMSKSSVARHDTPTTSKSSVTSKKSSTSVQGPQLRGDLTADESPGSVASSKENGQLQEDTAAVQTAAIQSSRPEEDGTVFELGEPPPPQDEFEMQVLNALQSMDGDNSGFITVDDVLNALQYQFEVLEFHEGHIEALQQLCLDVASLHHQSVHGPEGCLSYRHAVPDITDLLRQAAADSVTDLHEPGSLYMWTQLADAIAQQTIWLNRETGDLSLERPVEDQPTIRDEFFEETMVNMFIEHDQNGDGFLDRNEFLKLLQSTGVGSRLSAEQVEQLWALFAQSDVNTLDFNQFVPFARILILMIYGNQYQTADEWIELSCPICPQFWYSKLTGSCILLPPDILWGEVAESPSVPVSPGKHAAHLRRTGSAFDHLVGDQPTLEPRTALQPIPAPPPSSRQFNHASTPAPLAPINEDLESSRPGSSAA